MSTRLSRRTFLKAGAGVGAGLVLPGRWLAAAPPAAAFSQSQHLLKFIQPMRGVGGSGIPIAQPDTVRKPWWQPGVTHYTIDIAQFSDQLHPRCCPTHGCGATARDPSRASGTWAASSR